MVKEAELPRWVRSFLDESGYKRVQDAVIDAETYTNGEIVPLIVRSSTPTGHVMPLLTCLLLVIFLGVENLTSLLRAEPVQHPLVFTAGAVLCAGLSLLLSRYHPVQRLLTAPDDRALQVARRAELEFYEAHLHTTTGGTGVLLFVSLMERRAIVLADQSIATKLPYETWSKVVETMVSGIKAGDPAKGLVEAVRQTAVLLNPHFPRRADDVNELHDYLRIKE